MALQKIRQFKEIRSKPSKEMYTFNSKYFKENNELESQPQGYPLEGGGEKVIQTPTG